MQINISGTLNTFNFKPKSSDVFSWGVGSNISGCVSDSKHAPWMTTPSIGVSSLVLFYSSDIVLDIRQVRVWLGWEFGGQPKVCEQR